MKSKILFSILSITILLSSCKTPNIAVSDDLKFETSIYDVTGRHGWKFNKVIGYGDYKTSKIKQGWIKTYDIGFVARFQGAEQKLGFIQNTPDQMQAEVLAVSHFKNNEIALLDGFLSYNLEYDNSYAGTIVMSHNPEHIWDFVIYDPEGSFPDYTDCGIAKDQFGNEITIHGIKKLEGYHSWPQYENFGFEFRYNEEPIAAVSTMNKGRVWIKNDLHPDLKLVVSSLSTSLLVRESLIEHTSN